MRVLHCPADTGNHAYQLSRAERGLGVQSDLIVYSPQWFGYPNDSVIWKSGDSRSTKLFRAVRFLAHAVRYYDVFHFNSGRSLVDHRFWGLHHWDLPLLKRLGKKIVVTFQGCDARQKERTRLVRSYAACHECTVSGCDDRLDEQRRQRIARVVEYADEVFVLNPDLLEFVPGASWLPYASVDVNIPRPEYTLNPGKLRVAHLPSNRSIKGTNYVVSAVGSLVTQGVDIELDLIEGVPHASVAERLRCADVVVDQLLIGWYGGAALEALVLGKPVVCFLSDADLAAVGMSSKEIPIVRATKETLSNVLREIADNRGCLSRLSAASFEYARRVHHPRRVAERTLRAYGVR